MRARHRMGHRVLGALCVAVCSTILTAAAVAQPAGTPTATSARPIVAPGALATRPGVTPRNIVFILSDDHRYDAMGFLGHPFVQTPNMDRLAKGGAHVRNAFVTTALCSPSRASILTGTYAHRHGVVDNFTSIPPGMPNFAEYMRQARYQTAFIGKWHIGESAEAPQPGFDRWVSFRGQGSYLPDGSRTMLNVDGSQVPQRGYITDELTDYAVEWLNQTSRDRPFLLYLSHKGVHADFVPPERYTGSYASSPVTPPATMSPEAAVAGNWPTWVRNQRNSWHGVEYPYHSTLDVAEYYRRYLETLRGVDDSIGRVLTWLEQRQLLDSTLVVYMGDNGFAFGEHGLIDKRTAFDWSMRVPMVVHCPEWIEPGTVVDPIVANIDVAPTLLEAAGLERPGHMDGRSFAPLLRGERVPWRDALLYEYYWEYSFPQTPTQFALRGSRYKYVFTHGVWDIDMLFDLQDDPAESRNLIDDPAHQERARTMRAQLFEELAALDGMAIPLYPLRGGQQRLRNPNGSSAAPFPRVVTQPR